MATRELGGTHGDEQAKHLHEGPFENVKARKRWVARHVAAASLQLADACLGKCRATLAKDVGPPPDSVRMIFQVSAKCLGYKYCSMEGALPKFYEIAAAPRESARQQPSLLLRTLRTLFACEARDNALSAHTPRDLAMAAELEALPAAPLPLAAAVSLCMGRDSYIPALAQSTLLRTYGGIGKATHQHHRHRFSRAARPLCTRTP
ncbi:unnamed protein product [Symbiodinium microadriaticum]|nr:unnamed protein product [Symbiodinium microadriaticum]